MRRAFQDGKMIYQKNDSISSALEFFNSLHPNLESRFIMDVVFAKSDGKSIYAGDILLETFSDKSGTEIRVVEKSESSTGFDSAYIVGYEIGSYADSDYEIIGNKFEDPELINELKGKITQ